MRARRGDMATTEAEEREWAKVRELIARHPDWMDRPEHRAMMVRIMKRIEREHRAGGEELPF